MYALPSLSASSNYAATFRAPQKVEGWNEVKSDIAAQYLMQLPEKQFTAEVALAKQALAEKGAMIRRELEIDYYDRAREDAVKKSVAGALLGLGDPDGGMDLTEIGLGRGIDPMGQAVAREQQANTLQNERRGRMSQVSESAGAAIDGLGPLPRRSDYTRRDPLQLPNFQGYSAPQPSELNDRLTRELGSMKQFHETWSKAKEKR